MIDTFAPNHEIAVVLKGIRIGLALWEVLVFGEVDTKSSTFTDSNEIVRPSLNGLGVAEK
ncbi:MAG: hypothetical protein IH991_17105 [Planctomycetes bacterium]|nr:hypothetical protein [Planctomycetota bacterium]